MSCLGDVEVDGLDFTNVVAFGEIFHSLTTCQLQYWLFLEAISTDFINFENTMQHVVYLQKTGLNRLATLLSTPDT